MLKQEREVAKEKKAMTTKKTSQAMLKHLL